MGSFVNKMLNFVGFPEEEVRDEYENDNMVEDYEPSVFERFTERRSSRVVKLHNSQAQMRVVVMQPQSFDEAKDITNHLKSEKPVVINLESVEKAVARRIIDFLSGAVYALDGDIQKVSNGIFIIVPSNIDIMSDEIRNQAKNSFPWS